jgi:signal transduction histidine kinase
MSFINFQKDLALDEQFLRLRMKIDSRLKNILLIEWFSLVLIACVQSPYTWDGSSSEIHPHVVLSFLFGGCLTLVPWATIKFFPRAVFNSYLVTICQMAYSMLIIHFWQGRIEAHFHIFGSIALLACYRNPRIVILASVLAGVDHLVRGLYFPLSIYGVDSSSVLRSFEHAAWIFTEDIVLLLKISTARKEMQEIAHKQKELKLALASVEKQVEEREKELLKSQRIIFEQQEAMLNSSRLSSLGEMASGIAHEINNPLTIIRSVTAVLKKKVTRGEVVKNDELSESIRDIDHTVERVNNIVKGMRNLSKDASLEKPVLCRLDDVLGDVMSVCHEKFKFSKIQFKVSDRRRNPDTPIKLYRTQLAQVLLNLLTNAKDALEKQPDPEISILIKDDDENISIWVMDSGPTIPLEIREKIFLPFFSTKDIGTGTGLGLSISKKLIQNMGGDLTLSKGDQTCFLITIPGARSECA